MKDAALKTEDLLVCFLHPVHGAHIEALFQELAESLRGGWDGRPLLVEEADLPGPTRYHAWTGSHRIAAAKELDLERVPCSVISREIAWEVMRKHGYDVPGYSSLRDAVQGLDGQLDSHKLAALEKCGLDDAAELMRAEIEDNRRSERIGSRSSDEDGESVTL